MISFTYLINCVFLAVWIHLKYNYIGGALHPHQNYWGCLSTSSLHLPTPMVLGQTSFCCVHSTYELVYGTRTLRLRHKQAVLKVSQFKY